VRTACVNFLSTICFSHTATDHEYSCGSCLEYVCVFDALCAHAADTVRAHPPVVKLTRFCFVFFGCTSACGHRYVMGKLTALLERELVESLTDEMLPLVSGHERERRAPASASSSSSSRTATPEAVDVPARRASDAATSTASPEVDTKVVVAKDASTMVDAVLPAGGTDASTAMSPPPVPPSRLLSDAGTAMSPEPMASFDRQPSPPPLDPLDALRAVVGASDIRELLLALAGERASADESPQSPRRQQQPQPVAARSVAVGTPVPDMVSIATSPLPVLPSPSPPPQSRARSPSVRPPAPPEEPPSPGRFDATTAFSDAALGGSDPDASDGEILLSTDGEWVGDDDGANAHGDVNRLTDALEFVGGRKNKAAVRNTRAAAWPSSAADDGALSDGQLEPTGTMMLRARVDWHGVALSSTDDDSDSSSQAGTFVRRDRGAFPK
jgi:hypothetical protein